MHSTSRFLPVLLAGCLSAAACIPALPEKPAERALVRDMARVVDVRARTGWLVDEKEIDATLPDAMKSVCQVPEHHRRATLAWLDRQIALQGGDVAAVWRAKGRDLGSVDTLLLWTRVRLLMARADEWARLGRCPFWLEPSHAFRGVHIQGHRFVLTVEGGGRVIQEMKGSAIRHGAGGSGRLLFGRFFTSDLALLVGGEFGGDARFSELMIGGMQELPQLVAFVAAPMVLRWDFGVSVYGELEAGPMAFIDRASAQHLGGRVETSSAFGFRSGLTIGGSFLRLQPGVVPKFAFAVTFDAVPSGNLVQVGFGIRTGLDFSAWKGF